MPNTRRPLVRRLVDGFTEVTLYSQWKYPWSIVVSAKLDTGADRCSIDEGLAEALGLEVVGETTVRNAMGKQKRNLYFAVVEIDEVSYDLELTGSDRTLLKHPVLIGLDVITEIAEEE